MYKVCNKLPPGNIMLHSNKTIASHNHNVRVQMFNYKIRFRRTTKTSECISVKGPNMWNDMFADTKLCKSMFTCQNCTNPYFCNLINLCNAFVLLVGPYAIIILYMLDYPVCNTLAIIITLVGES